MNHIKIVFLLVLFMAVTGCGTTDYNFPEEYVPGEVVVKFADNVTKAEAEELISKLSLTPLDLSDLEVESHPNWVTIGVPEGQEKIWVKQFSTYSIVEAAELNGIVRAL